VCDGRCKVDVAITLVCVRLLRLLAHQGELERWCGLLLTCLSRVRSVQSNGLFDEDQLTMLHELSVLLQCAVTQIMLVCASTA
jgi:hypothetical protein